MRSLSSRLSMHTTIEGQERVPCERERLELKRAVECGIFAVSGTRSHGPRPEHARAAAPRAQSAPAKIRVGSLPADTYAGGYYALDLGFSRKPA